MKYVDSLFVPTCQYFNFAAVLHAWKQGAGDERGWHRHLPDNSVHGHKRRARTSLFHAVQGGYDGKVRRVRVIQGEWNNKSHTYSKLPLGIWFVDHALMISAESILEN